MIKMRNYDEFFRGIFVLFFILFVMVVLIPAIGEATGANITFVIIAFLILAIGVIASILKRF